jgi:hypothetical protein
MGNTVAEAIDVQRVVDGIYRSSESNQAITIDQAISGFAD